MLGLVDVNQYPVQLEKEGAVGEISYCFFDKNGCGRAEWELFLSPGRNTQFWGPHFFANMVKRGKTVIVIAGQHKEDAIRAALAGKLFNVWITDDRTARLMLKTP